MTPRTGTAVAGGWGLAARRAGMTVLAAIFVLAAMVPGLGAGTALAASGEFSGRLAFRLSAIDPIVVTADGPGAVTLVGRFTNTGPDAIDDIEFRFQRGAALTTPAAVQAEVDAPTEPTEVVGNFRPLPGVFEAGAAMPFAITVPVFARPAAAAGTESDGEGAVPDDGTGPDEASLIDSLGITEPGVYPVLLNVNATLHVGDASARARVGELHVLVTVASVPATEPGAEPDPAGAATPVHILWPLADRPHLGVGDVFADDDLAAEISGDGRLATALAALEQAAPDPDLVTIVVDPMLLDELQRMADGYRVLTDPDSVQARLRPDGVIPGTTAGTGQRAAADFLDRLRAQAATHRVLVLPYGDADLAALTRAGMTDEATEAVARGRDAATRVLVRGPRAMAIYRNLLTDIAVPPGGVLTDATLSLLNGLGERAVVLGPGSVATASGTAVPDGLVAIEEPTHAHDAVLGVVAGGDRATQFGDVLAGTLHLGTAEAVSRLAAEFWTTPAARRSPIIVAPARDFTASAAGLTALGRLVDELSTSHTLAATSLPAVLSGGPPGAADAPTPVTLAYSAAARSAELPLGYLRRVDDVHRQIDTVRQSLSRADAASPDPRDVTDALADALLPAVSSAWRAAADPAAHRLQTIDATLVWLYGGVQIARDTGSYTLASSTAPLLLTVRNTLPYQVTVTVAIVGGAQAGLQAADPGPVTVGAGPRSMPVKLDTVVSRSGTFTVYAQLYGADGAQWSAPVPLAIASRAYGALTVILMATAGGVLVLMVVWRLVQRLRGRIDDPGNRPVGPDDGAGASDEPAEPGEPGDSATVPVTDATVPVSDDAVPVTDDAAAGPDAPGNADGRNDVIQPTPAPERDAAAREGP